MKTVNKDIACSLFPTHAVEPQRTSSGLVFAPPRTNLVPLRVLAGYPPLGLVAGDLVYVPLEFGNTAWGKRKLSVPEIGEFILVPADQVHLVKSES